MIQSIFVFYIFLSMIVFTFIADRRKRLLNKLFPLAYLFVIICELVDNLIQEKFIQD